MSASKAVVGVFGFYDDAIKAIKRIREANYQYKVYSPVLNDEINELTIPERSSVRKFNITGAMTGCLFGFALAILCSLDWPLRVSAKDIVSVPGFVVIGYECTILFGSIATLLSILHFCKLPNVFRNVGYDPRFSHDRFGIVVWSEGAEVDRIKSTLLELGAEEIKVEEGL